MNNREIFNGFKSLKIWEQDVQQLWRAITATWVSLTPHSMLTLWDSSKVPEETVVKKQPSLQPSSLTVSSYGQHDSCNRTYGRTMYSVGTGELISMKFWWNDKEKQKFSTKTCPTATLPTTNPQSTGLGLNLGVHGRRYVTSIHTVINSLNNFSVTTIYSPPVSHSVNSYVICEMRLRGVV